MRTNLVHLGGQAFPSIKLQWLEEEASTVCPEELQCQKEAVTTRSWRQAVHRSCEPEAWALPFWSLSGMGTLDKPTVSRQKCHLREKIRCW